MKYAYVLMGFLLVLCMSCDTPQSESQDGGSFTYNGSTYALKSARLQHYQDSISADNRLQLVLCSPTMSFANGKLSGYGELLCITFSIESSDLLPNIYNISDSLIIASESYYLHISSDKTDTIKNYLVNGSIDVCDTEEGQKYYFNFGGDVSIQGSYEGTVTYSNDVDGNQVGSLVIGDSIIPLQKGDLMLWGPVFSEQLYYYEFYFYSCNMRYDDSGTIKQGIMFVVGLQSQNAIMPTEGVYPINRQSVNQTALYGHKSGDANWGTYWVEYLSSTAQTKAYVMRDTVAFSRTGDTYGFTFHCTDQLNNVMTGTYHGEFNLIDIR